MARDGPQLGYHGTYAVGSDSAVHAGRRVPAGVRPNRAERCASGRREAMPDSQEVILTTCPRDCFDTCGIAVVKRNGVVAHVRGDPYHPVSRGRLCAKCSLGYNREWRDPQARLTRPLRRVGPKGEGRFEPISWETALATMADRLKQIV